MKQIILPGDKFGYLEVIEEVHPYVSKSGNSFRQFIFRCCCGKLITKKLGPIRESRVVSCGCYNNKRRTKHDLSKTDLYQVWIGMRQRCYNPRNLKYATYGGKGIAVCSEWNNSVSAFVEWALSNGYSQGLTIDRIDSNGDYCPTNCRIVDYSIQNNNTNRNHFVEIFGERKTIAEWSKDVRCVVNYETFAARIKRDWNPFVALTKPKQKRNGT